MYYNGELSESEILSRHPALLPIAQLLEKVTIRERTIFLDWMQARPDLWGEIVFTGRVILNKVLTDRKRAWVELAQKDGALRRQRKHAAVKKGRTARRHVLIDQIIEAGTNPNNAQAIFDFVRNEDVTLLYKSKKTTDFIDSKMMMLMYWRSKGGKNNCNHSE